MFKFIDFLIDAVVFFMVVAIFIAVASGMLIIFDVVSFYIDTWYAFFGSVVTILILWVAGYLLTRLLNYLYHKNMGGDL